MEDETVDNVQPPCETSARKGEKPPRGQAEKVGHWKYLWQRLDHLERKVSRIEHRTRAILRGYKPLLEYSEAFIREVIAKDAVDAAILNILMEAGTEGKLPSQISTILAERGFRGVARWEVTRRIQGMNRRLKREVEESAAEKRGHRWALTSFMREVWNSTLKEAEEVREAQEG
ncbi:MAG: hypothetical protein QW231_02270 [Candidatus Bathyarchaeia archaeon]